MGNSKSISHLVVLGLFSGRLLTDWKVQRQVFLTKRSTLETTLGENVYWKMNSIGLFLDWFWLDLMNHYKMGWNQGIQFLAYCEKTETTKSYKIFSESKDELFFSCKDFYHRTFTRIFTSLRLQMHQQNTEAATVNWWFWVGIQHPSLLIFQLTDPLWSHSRFILNLLCNRNLPQALLT